MDIKIDTPEEHCTRCGEKVLARGLCRRHYDQWRKTDPVQVEKFKEANRRLYRRKRNQNNGQ